MSGRLILAGLIFWTWVYTQIVGAQTNVTVWGNNVYGQINVPPNVTNAVAISAGGEHIMALRADSTVVAWGDNSFGQTSIPPTLKLNVAIAAGCRHSLVLRGYGPVLAWGSYAGTNVPRNFTNVIAIAASGAACHGGHGLALKRDGTVTAWGDNGFGQTNVPPDLTNVVAVAAGDVHNLALKSDGSVVAWGSFAGTNVPAGLSDVVAVSAGGEHSLALRRNGTILAWGSNSSGQTNAPASSTNIVAIAAGRWHSLALRADGTVSAWGKYHDGTYSQTMTVPPGLTNVTAIDAGEWTSVALLNGPPMSTAPASNPTLSSNTFSVEVASQKGSVYGLEKSHSLSQPNWIGLPLQAGTGAQLTLTDPAATHSESYYRVRRW